MTYPLSYTAIGREAGPMLSPGRRPTDCDQSPDPGGPRPRVKAEEAYMAIRELLTEFSRVPGRQISDRDLSLRLRISRTPVREALIRLAAEGQILSIPQKGYFSKPQHERHLLDSYEVVEGLFEFALSHANGEIGEDASALLPPPRIQDPATKLAGQLECVFRSVARRSGNRELAVIIDRFSASTRPIRVEIAAHDRHGRAFQKSLAGLREAVGNDSETLGPALKRHLALERRLVPRFVREINARASITAPFAFGEE